MRPDSAEARKITVYIDSLKKKKLKKNPLTNCQRIFVKKENLFTIYSH